MSFKLLTCCLKSLLALSSLEADKELQLESISLVFSKRCNLKKKYKYKNLNYVGVRIYQGIRMIKRSEMRPLGGATFWDNHLPAVTMIFTPILVRLKPKILLIRWCHFLGQSPTCVGGCMILYVGQSRLHCKRFSPFSCHLIGSHPKSCL